MNADRLNGISQQVIGCAYSVGNVLGAGFLERVYRNALAHELGKAGLTVEMEKPLQVLYDGIVVGDFFADLLIEGRVLVELKAVAQLDDTHVAQCVNYLRATGLNLCLLINFGVPRVQIKRVVNRL